MPALQKPISILIIEDNTGDLVLFESYLRQTSLLVSAIDHMVSINELRAKKSFDYDIAFLDLSLPDSTGIDSFSQLNNLIPGIPIVVLSGMDDEEVALNCIAMGAQDYLLKNDLNEKFLEKSVHYSIERKRNLERLSRVNKQFEMIANITNDIIWNWNLATNEVLSAKQQFFEYSENEIGTTMEWWFEKIHPEDQERIQTAITNMVAGKTDTAQEEYRFLSAEGIYRYVFNRAIVVAYRNGKPAQVIGAMMDLTEHKELQDELVNAKIDFQKKVTEAAIQGQEKEKEEIGKELHDNINQILVSTKLYMDVAAHNSEMKDELILKSKENIVYAIDEIRKLSHSLIPPELHENGFRDALEELVDEINMAGQFRAVLHADFNESLLDENRKLMLYRVLQEQVNNIVKHAKASRVDIRIKSSGRQVGLEISDDGIGFDPSSKAKGVGLRNIHSRVSHYSGIMELQSSPGKGTSLKVTLPV